MRLTTAEVTAIKQCAQYHFENAQVYLFGSRLDANKKGGDIDLYIETTQTEHILQSKIAFLLALQQRIGEQRIDVLINSHPTKESKLSIYQQAKATGIRL